MKSHSVCCAKRARVMYVIIALYKTVIVVFCHALMPPRCLFAKSRAPTVGNAYSHWKIQRRAFCRHIYLQE